MQKLSSNIYNKNLRQDERKLKLWRYAGLLLTYKCPAACDFCYYNCSPEKGGLMPIETGLNAWQSLINLAGNAAEIHITGGEPFMYFDHLVRFLAEADKLNLTGMDAVETNAYWADDEALVKDRLQTLKDLGAKRIKISWDPFHAEYIRVENIKLLSNVAMDILGPENTLVRWEKYLNEDIETPVMGSQARLKLIEETISDFPVRFTGRAGLDLALHFADKPVEWITGQNCEISFLSAKGVHIDPYGNVFSGLCSGISVGNINEKPLKDIWQEFNPADCEYINKLFKASPTALLSLAAASGYRIKPAYAGKCHLCTDLRQFFFDKGLFKSIIAPADCYM